MKALAIVLLLSACATTGTTRIPADNATTYCTTNATAGYGLLRMHAGQQSVRVEPGQMECKLLQGSGVLRIWGNTIGGGAHGPIRVEGEIQLDKGCWHWEVNNTANTFPMRCESARPAADTMAREEGVMVRLSRRYMGFTFCDEIPVGFIRLDAVSAPKLREQVFAHEQKHIDIILRDGGCEGHRNRLRREPLAKMLAEAEAFCAQAQVVARQERWPLELATYAFGIQLSHYMEFGLSEPEAIAHVRSFCL